MNNPFTLKISLKQHSPLIHFQCDQDGASLRATELKPKLDRYILEKEFKNDCLRSISYLVGFDKKIYDKLDISGRKIYCENMHKALNYKVTIKNTRIRSREKYRIFTEDKMGIWYSQVEVHFFSFNTRLIEIIGKHVSDFFILHQFGLGQSKGFGGFTIADTESQLFESTIKKEEKYNVFYKMKQPKKGDYKNMLDCIKREYQLLKSGINHNGYEKSKLFEYMCRKGINWEKRYIKEALRNDYPDVFDLLAKKGTVNRIASCRSSRSGIAPNYKYIRALLGLAEHNEYQTEKFNKSNLARIRIKIKDENDKNIDNPDACKDKVIISRFQSPIRFKVFNNYLYLLPESLPESIFNHGFSFYLEKEFKGGRKVEEKRPLFTISTPSKDEFDLVDFLDSHLDRFDASGNGTRWQRKEGEKAP